MKVAGALLAAGAARRYGRPKALLPYRGSTFLRHLATELGAVAAPLLVVRAPEGEALERELVGLDVVWVVNRRAAEGQGTSIAAAAEALASRAPGCEALLLALVDQPLAGRELFSALVAAAAAGAGIAASDYGDGTTGPPALFPRASFDDLARLAGDEGARRVLDRAAPWLSRVAFPGGRLDVDSPEDYARLLAADLDRG